MKVYFASIQGHSLIIISGEWQLKKTAPTSNLLQHTSDRKHPFSKAPSICKALFAMHNTWIIMILSDDQDNWHIKYPIRRKMRHYIIHPINTQFYWLTSSQIDQTWPVNWCLLSFQEVRSSVVVHCTLDNSESILATSSTWPCILLVTLINKSSTCIFLSGIL